MFRNKIKSAMVVLIFLAVSGLLVSSVSAAVPNSLYNSNEGHTDVLISGTNTAAQKFTANAAFDCIDVACPSYSNNIGSLTLTLYKWSTDYNTTITGTPIATKTHVDFKDNGRLFLNFAQQSAGDYVWVLSNPIETVGVWKYANSNNTDDNVVTYFNGSVVSGNYDSNIYYTVPPEKLYSLTSAQAHSAYQITGTNTVGERFSAMDSFSGIDVNCPSYANNIGSLTLSLYIWNSDYNTSVSSAPIATQTYTNFNDNAWLKLDFSQKPEGEYLWVLSNPAEMVGVWQYMGSIDPNTAYINGAETAGDFESRIYYTIPKSNLYDVAGSHLAVPLTDSNTAGEKFSATNYFNSIEVACPSYLDNIGKLTLTLYQWNNDYDTTIAGTPVISQEFVNYPDNYNLKLNFKLQSPGDYLWVLGNPFQSVGVWKRPDSNTANVAYINGSITTGDYESRVYYLSGSTLPQFTTDAPNNFEENLNKMWSIYGAINDGTNAVYMYGNEPSYFDWLITKVMWSNETKYKNSLKSKIQNFAMDANGYVWSWADQSRWPSGNSLHFGNNINYICAVYSILAWEHSTDFLNQVDTNTTGLNDASKGMTVGQKLDLAMSYILNSLNGANGLMIIDNGENTGKADGHASNYWDNPKFGYKDAYSNIYFYKALLSMSGIESMRGNQTNAAYYADLAAEAKANYDATFYDTGKGRYVGSIDVTGHVWDFGFSFVNLEALANGLGDNTKAASIFGWLDGSRIIAGDTSTGTDIYDAFKYAPRANTLKIESTGAPYWWNDLGGFITVTGNASWGQHLENGGTIFYISFFDLLARAKYLGADNAKARFDAIMAEFAGDELRRDRINSYGNAWIDGVIGEYPESGLVPTAFLYGFQGISATKDGLVINPNLSTDMTYAGVNNLVYDSVLYHITTYSSKKIEIATDNGSTKTINVKIGNLTPNTAYTIINYDLTHATNVTTMVTSNASGEISLSESVAGSRKIVLQP